MKSLRLWLAETVLCQQHPDPKLRLAWNLTQLAVLLLPFSSLLGSVGILFATLMVWQHKGGAIVRRPLNCGFAVLTLLMLVSTVFAFKQTDAALGLFNFLPFFWVFAALSELLQTVTQLRRLVWLLVIASVPVVLIGIGQQFWGWAGQLHLLGLVLDWEITPMGNPPGRMASVFFYANVLASYLIITFTLSLGLWIEHVRYSSMGHRNASPLHVSFKPQRAVLHWQLVFLTVAVLGNAIALIFTNSRNAWAIALLASLAYALYLGWSWLLAVVGVVAGSVLGAAFGPSPVQAWLRTIVPAFFWARLTDQLYPDRPVGTLRVTQWKFAGLLAQQRPLTGWGLRNFSPLYQTQTHVFMGHPHNLPLMLASEIGLPATFLFFGLIGWVLYQGIKLLDKHDHPRPTLSEIPSSSPSILRLSELNQGTEGAQALVVFTTLVAFLSCAIFSLFDITFFDVRINVMNWLLLSAICGLVYGRWGSAIAAVDKH